jgi:hypothetical protein
MWSGQPVDAWTGRELLVFLVPGSRYASHHQALATAPWVARTGASTTGLYDLAKPAPAYTTGWKVLRKRDELLAAVRAAATSTATKSQQLDLPSGTDAYDDLYGGSVVWITVPVDAALEQLALGWLASQSLFQREDAVGALAHFESAANTARLVALLADPDYSEVSESGKPTFRRYLVRKRAHEVLTAWGVAHQPPVIDEKKP